MGKYLLIVICLLQGSAYATSPIPNKNYVMANEVITPVVNDRGSLTQAQAGTMVYDTSSGAFFGLPVGGDPATAGDWIQLSVGQGTVPVSSGGTERLERAHITCATTSSVTNPSTSGWITAGNNSSGTCTLTFTTGIFGGTPACTIGHNTAGLGYTGNVVTTSSIAGSLKGSNWNGATFVADTNFQVDIICMGQKP